MLLYRSNDIQNIVLYMYSAFNAYIVKKARESLVSDIPVGDWKIANLFYRFYRFFYRFDLCLLYFWFNTIHKHSVIMQSLTVCSLFECLIKLCTVSFLSF
jgi:hypothetical protein